MNHDGSMLLTEGIRDQKIPGSWGLETAQGTWDFDRKTESRKEQQGADSRLPLRTGGADLIPHGFRGWLTPPRTVRQKGG